MNKFDWQHVFEIYRASKAFFRESADSRDTSTYLNTIKELSISCDCFIVLNDSTDVVVEVYTDESYANHDSSELVEVLPLLFGACGLTQITQDEINYLQKTLLFKQDKCFSAGCYFGIEINDLESAFFVFLVYCEAGSLTDEQLSSFSHIEQFLNEFLKTSILAEKGTELAEELRFSKKRQNVWLESLAWINQASSSDFSEAELQSFYEHAVFQLKTLVIAESAIAYHVDTIKAPHPDTTNQTLIPFVAFEYSKTEAATGLQDFLYDSVTLETFKRNEYMLVEETRYPMLNELGIGCALLLPLFVQQDLRQIIVLIRSENTFTDNEIKFTMLFGEGIEHIIERRDLMRSIRKRNLALQQERNEQQKLISQLKEAQEQLLQQEKMASIGQLAAGVAHEINNPVGYVNSNINSLSGYMDDLFTLVKKYEELENELAEDHPLRQKITAYKKEIDYEFVQEDVQELVEESIEGVVRVKDIVKDLKDFSHVDEGEWQLANLNRGIQSTLNIVNNEIKYKADVELDLGDIPDVQCQSSQINQIIMNLLVNASHAMDERGIIKVRTWQDDDFVIVEVSDNGKGIAQEHLTKIFDPFFTTKPVGEGTGLGLSLSYSIAEKHRGDLSVRSVVGKGTAFRLKLPIKQDLDDE